MDEQEKRAAERAAERAAATGTAEERAEVDIRRSMIMGRDLGIEPRAGALMRQDARILHWSPILAGVVTSVTFSLLFGALFLGLGFNRTAVGINGVSAQGFATGSLFAVGLSVLLGGFVTGLVGNKPPRTETLMNGFLMGCLSVLLPVLLTLFGTFGLAQTAAQATAMQNASRLPSAVVVVPPGQAPPSGTTTTAPRPGGVVTVERPTALNNLGYGLAIAADQAWKVFWGGLLMIGLGVLGAYGGSLTRMKQLANRVVHRT